MKGFPGLWNPHTWLRRGSAQQALPQEVEVSEELFFILCALGGITSLEGFYQSTTQSILMNCIAPWYSGMTDNKTATQGDGWEDRLRCKNNGFSTVKAPSLPSFIRFLNLFKRGLRTVSSLCVFWLSFITLPVKILISIQCRIIWLLYDKVNLLTEVNTTRYQLVGIK